MIVAEYMLKNSVVVNNEINWLSKTPSSVDGIYEYMPATYECYGSLGGVGFFFLYMYKFTGIRKYLEVTENIMYNSKRLFVHKLQGGYYESMNKVQKQNTSLGPLEFPLCNLYLMEHLDSIKPGSFDMPLFKQTLEWYEEFLNVSKTFDYLLGKIGVIISFIMYHSSNLNKSNVSIGSLFKSSCFIELGLSGFSVDF